MWNIAGAAAESKLTIDTIRFYERSKLLPKLPRDKRGWRQFDKSSLEWLVVLERLRATGMPLKDMRRFTTLVFAKDSDSPKSRAEKIEILRRHKQALSEQRQRIELCEDYLEYKIRIYTDKQ